MISRTNVNEGLYEFYQQFKIPIPSWISVKPAGCQFLFHEPNMFNRSLRAAGRRLLAEQSVGAQSEGKYVDRDVEWLPLSFAPVLPNLWC